MIPNTKNPTVLESGKSLASIKMTFDENSIQHLMSVLTDLYSDPVLATIREVSTNGWDSHVAAGTTVPIEVSLPSEFDRTFIVQDYGLGLSEDELRDVYSKYGASTKRESNDVVGMLGLGCKAPLTYTTQFSIECVKDGERVFAVLSRTDTGSGSIEIIQREYTSEPNGVKVSVPVSNIGEFNKKAKDFFKFWPSGSVLVDGVEPALTFDGMVQINDSTIAFNSNDGWYGKNWIVMGNVPYPFEGNLPGVSRKTKIVHYAPIGSVNIVPSRESLHDTDLTRNYLKQALADAGLVVRSRIQDEVTLASNITEAIARADMLDSYNGITWNGYDIASNIIKGKHYDRLFTVRYGRTSEQKSHQAYLTNIAVRNGIVIVTDYTNITFTKDHYRKIAVEAGFDPEVIIMCNTVVPLWKNLPVVSWDDAKKADIGKTKGKGVSYGASDEYIIYEPDGKSKAKRTTKPGEKYVYLSPADESTSVNSLVNLLDGKHIVLLPKNREAKFLRNNPKAQSWRAAVKEAVADLENKYTMHERRVAYGKYPSWASKLDHTKINDPEMATMLKESLEPADDDKVSKLRQMRNIDKINLTCDDPDGEAVEKYPLLKEAWWGMNRDDIIEYINALYEYRRNK